MSDSTESTDTESLEILKEWEKWFDDSYKNYIETNKTFEAFQQYWCNFFSNHKYKDNVVDLLKENFLRQEIWDAKYEEWAAQQVEWLKEEPSTPQGEDLPGGTWLPPSGDDEEEDMSQTWFPQYANCACCKGLVYGCHDVSCNALGVCVCKAGDDEIKRQDEQPLQFTSKPVEKLTTTFTNLNVKAKTFEPKRTLSEIASKGFTEFKPRSAVPAQTRPVPPAQANDGWSTSGGWAQTNYAPMGRGAPKKDYTYANYPRSKSTWKS
eukprot:Colp12_sorted_trinity150504_noHs@33048